MPASPITTYLARLRADLQTGDATERTHYSTLRALPESFTPGVTAPVEPKRIACGAPDFRVRKGQLLIGYVEAKDVGLNLDEVAASAQLKKRYLPALANLILTNHLEFRWYVNGAWRATAHLGRLSDGRVTGSREGTQEAARPRASALFAARGRGAAAGVL